MENVPGDLEEPMEPRASIHPQEGTIVTVPDSFVGGYLKSNDFKELLACLAFLLLSMTIFLFNVSPRQRPIPFQYLQASNEYVVNLSNAEPFDGETVPDTLLYVLAVIMPAAFQATLAYFKGVPQDLHRTVCVYVVAFAIVLLSTEGIKLYCGVLRPIFFEICQPDEGYQECSVTGRNATSIRQSFPSGHASTSFCGLSLLSLYVHTRWGVPSLTPHTPVVQPYRQRFISLLSLLPIALAVFIASSRVVDNKHFPADILAGALLGSAAARFVHSLWYYV